MHYDKICHSMLIKCPCDISKGSVEQCTKKDFVMESLELLYVQLRQSDQLA